MSRQQVLVDADWVAEHAGDENTVLVEVDEDTTAYDGGHISGAVKLDWKKDLQDPSAVTSSTRSSSRSCYPSEASATTTPSCSTAATTTGSQRMRTGISSFTGTTRSCCSTEDARSGSWTRATSAAKR